MEFCGERTATSAVPRNSPLTAFAVAGIANSVNIIDGFNGLAAIASPDAWHLHSLIFRRVMHPGRCAGRTDSNPVTSLYLWVLSSLAVLPAALFWDNTPVLLFFCAAFIGVYLWLYRSIVRFRTPRWLFLR